MTQARGGKKAEIVAVRLREARALTDLTQKELGILAGMDPTVASARMNQYEQAKNMPNVAVLTAIGQVLGLPLAYFFAEDDLAELIARFSAAPTRIRRSILRILRG